MDLSEGVSDPNAENSAKVFGIDAAEQMLKYICALSQEL